MFLTVVVTLMQLCGSEEQVPEGVTVGFGIFDRFVEQRFPERVQTESKWFAANSKQLL